MREIDFRGHESPLFAGENKKKKPKWLYGSLRNTSEEHPQIAEPPMGLWCNVEPETVGQYTGLKDKNGVKIYEGDVLDVTACPDTRYIGVVVYNSHVASFEILFEEAEMGFPLQDDFDMEVVGNIFDDPELDKQFGEVYRKEQ